MRNVCLEYFRHTGRIIPLLARLCLYSCYYNLCKLHEETPTIFFEIYDLLV